MTLLMSALFVKRIYCAVISRDKGHKDKRCLHELICESIKTPQQECLQRVNTVITNACIQLTLFYIWYKYKI